jgi:hypothetical protein
MMTGTVNVVGMVDLNILIGGTFLGPATVNPDGTWSMEVDTTFEVNGASTLTASPVNGVGGGVGTPAVIDITVDN